MMGAILNDMPTSRTRRATTPVLIDTNALYCDTVYDTGYDTCGIGLISKEGANAFVIRRFTDGSSASKLLAVGGHLRSITSQKSEPLQACRIHARCTCPSACGAAVDVLAGPTIQ